MRPIQHIRFDFVALVHKLRNFWWRYDLDLNVIYFSLGPNVVLNILFSDTFKLSSSLGAGQEKKVKLWSRVFLCLGFLYNRWKVKKMKKWMVGVSAPNAVRTTVFPRFTQNLSNQTLPVCINISKWRVLRRLPETFLTAVVLGLIPLSFSDFGVRNLVPVFSGRNLYICKGTASTLADIYVSLFKLRHSLSGSCYRESCGKGFCFQRKYCRAQHRNRTDTACEQLRQHRPYVSVDICTLWLSVSENMTIQWFI